MTTRSQRPDPPQRPDGLCAGCQRPLPLLVLQTRDAWCSATCARAYHGCPVPAESIWRARARQAEPPPPHGSETRYADPHKCRCDECREAVRQGRARRRQVAA